MSETAGSLPPLGLVDVPHMQAAALELELDVLTSDAPSDALALVLDYAHSHGALPVVISAAAADASPSLVQELSLLAHVVVVGEAASLPAGAHPVALPTTPAALLHAAGFAYFPQTPATELTITAPDAPSATPDEADVADGYSPTQESFDDSDAHPAPTTELSTIGGACVVVWSGKGGVGKSTIAMALADRAAERGLKVLLVDSNDGQGDTRTYLRGGAEGLPTIHEAVGADPGRAVIPPEVVNDERSVRLEPIRYSTVLAPPAHLAGRAADAATYLRVVQWARTQFDLVVVDTQIVEAHDRGGMTAGLISPLFATGAFGLAVTDLSPPGVANLLTHLKAFAADGRGSQLTVLNQARRSRSSEVPGHASALGGLSHFIGTIFDDETLEQRSAQGQRLSTLPEVAAALDATLLEVLPTSAPPHTAARTHATALTKEKKPWFRRR